MLTWCTLRFSDVAGSTQVRYEAGDFFNLHHDSSAKFQSRLATLIIYLNTVEPEDGGSTFFPFAGAPDDSGWGAAFGNGDGAGGPGVLAGALAEAQAKHDAGVNGGLRVHPEQGSAVLFYNLDEALEVDIAAIHSALPLVRGEKWIANFWIAAPEVVVVGSGGGGSGGVH